MTELQPIIVFHGRHFVHHLGICNRIYVKFLQLMYAVIAHNLVKKTKSHFVRYLGICNRIYVKFLQLMYAVIAHKLVKKTKSHY